MLSSKIFHSTCFSKDASRLLYRLKNSFHLTAEVYPKVWLYYCFSLKVLFLIQVLAFYNKTALKIHGYVDIRLKVYILISLREIPRSATFVIWELLFGNHQTVFLCDCMIYDFLQKGAWPGVCILTSIVVVTNFYFSHSAKYVVTSLLWF